MEKLNLKHLKAISTVVECGSAWKAAQALGVSAANISYTLKQAQKISGESLFFRTTSGLKPTSAAMDIYQNYLRLVSVSSMKEDVTISTGALLEFLYAQGMYHNADKEGIKKLNFVTQNESAEERIRLLQNRQVDIDIGELLPANNSIQSTLYVSSDVCIMKSIDNHCIGDTITEDEWRQQEHLYWTTESSAYFYTDDTIPPEKLNAFEQLLVERKIFHESANTIVLSYLCSHGNCLMLMPEIFIPQLQKLFPVQKVTPLFDFPMKYNCFFHWHKASDKNFILTFLPQKSIEQYFEEEL